LLCLLVLEFCVYDRHAVAIVGEDFVKLDSSAFRSSVLRYLCVIECNSVVVCGMEAGLVKVSSV
jgi:hypothetical protein